MLRTIHNCISPRLPPSRRTLENLPPFTPCPRSSSHLPSPARRTPAAPCSSAGTAGHPSRAWAARRARAAARRGHGRSRSKGASRARGGPARFTTLFSGSRGRAREKGGARTISSRGMFFVSGRRKMMNGMERIIMDWKENRLSASVRVFCTVAGEWAHSEELQVARGGQHASWEREDHTNARCRRHSLRRPSARTWSASRGRWRSSL